MSPSLGQGDDYVIPSVMARRSAGHPGDTALMSKTYYVYILASKRNGTIYIGVTSDLARRAWEHREGLMPGFTKTYGVKMLVYYEALNDIEQAIRREKRLKKYKREWKMNLIQQNNVEWHDLSGTL
jgi:putative endonuclease